MSGLDDDPLSIDEIARRLKCPRGWAQLSVDAGCPLNGDGKVSLRDFMLFQLTNIHRIRELAGLPPMALGGSASGLRPTARAMLSTQLEWLQLKSTRAAVKAAAKLVQQRLDALG